MSGGHICESIDNARHIAEKAKLDKIRAERLAKEEEERAAREADEPGAGGSSGSGHR